MLALLKKNFAFGYWMGSIIFILIGLMFSTFDLLFSFPEEMWIFFLIFIFILTCCVGLGTFNSDYNKDNIQFLNYLPIKRSEIWLANFADGFISLFLVILALSWYRTMTYTASAGNFYNRELLFLFNNRWDLMVGGGAVCFWCFSLSMFFRIFIKSETHSTVLVVLCLFIIVIAFIGALGFLNLTPSLVEFVPLFFLSGLLFTVSGFTVFAKTPSYLEPWKQLLGFCLPGFFIIMTLFTTYFYFCCEKWQELIPGEKLFISGIDNKTVNKNNRQFLVTKLRSSRSGTHIVSIDLDNGQYYDIRRHRYYNYNYDVLNCQNKLNFMTEFPFHSLFPGQNSYIQVDPDGQNYKILFELHRDTSRKINAAESQYRISYSSFKWSKDEEYLVYGKRLQKPGANYFEADNFLIISDSKGKILKEVSVQDMNSFQISDENRLLYIKKKEIDRKNQPQKKPSIFDAKSEYILQNVDSDDIINFSLPGPLITFSPDFTKAICLRLENKSNQLFSVVLVEIPKGEERVLIPSSDLVSQVTANPIVKSAGKRIFTNVPVISSQGSCETQYPLCFNESFDKMVWTKKVLSGESYNNSLILIDLNTSKQQVLVDVDELATIPVTVSGGYNYPIKIYGFVPSGDALVFRNNNTLYSKNILNGDKTIMAILPEVENSYKLKTYISPDGKKILTQFEARSKDKQVQYTYKVYENGESRLIHSFSVYNKSAYPFLLNDDQLIVPQAYRILLINADGSEKKIISDFYPDCPERNLKTGSGI